MFNSSPFTGEDTKAWQLAALPVLERLGEIMPPLPLRLGGQATKSRGLSRKGRGKVMENFACSI